MRDIIFRAKRLDNGEWVVDSYCLAERLDRSGEDHHIIEYAANGCSYKVDPATVGQYCGVVDRNGRKIFEGDIVRVPMTSYTGKETSEVGVVEWLNGAFSVTWISAEGRHFVGYLHSVEVIGTKWDNPELLQG